MHSVLYLITYWVLLEFPTQAQGQVAYAQFTHETFNTATVILKGLHHCSG